MSSKAALAIGTLVFVTVSGLWALHARGQVVKPDLTPFKDSPEVQQLIEGTLTPDPDEPAAAVKIYIEVEQKFREAMDLSKFGPDQTEAMKTIDVEPPLNEAIAAMQDATRRYPTSRTAWMGLGSYLWNKYERRHRAQDLRDAVQAYTKATNLMRKKGTTTGAVGRDFANLAAAITRGLAALKDDTTLDAFFRQLGETEFKDLALFPYTEALATLKDPRADRLYQRMLAGAKPKLPNSILESYIEYLFDQGKYNKVLELLGEIPPSDIKPPVYTRWFHLVKGTTMERLGRLDEAKAEYQGYLDEVAKQKQVWPYVFPANERFRIPGSPLQQGIEFSREPYELPEPQSSTLGSWLLGWLSPSPAWADHVATPACASTDWLCKAQYYLVWTIRGEAGCVWDDQNSQWCTGTTGGQRAVAWNVRTRVFWGYGSRVCSGSTQVCFNYAAGITQQGDLNSVARRYYYVIDWGSYGGLILGRNIGYKRDAEDAAAKVALYGRAPDPIRGACLAGGMIGNSCDGSCSADAGYLNSFLASESGIEFRSGTYAFQCYGSCCLEQLHPSDSPSGSACGSACFAQVGAICPKWEWLESSCIGYANPYWGPKWGNYYWRFNR